MLILKCHIEVYPHISHRYAYTEVPHWGVTEVHSYHKLGVYTHRIRLYSHYIWIWSHIELEYVHIYMCEVCSHFLILFKPTDSSAVLKELTPVGVSVCKVNYTFSHRPVQGQVIILAQSIICVKLHTHIYIYIYIYMH